MNNKLNVPLINTHTHAAMIAFRWKWEDMCLDKWLTECIWPLEQQNLSKDFVYKNTKKAVKEMKANKIAGFCDMYFFEDEVARVACEEKIYVVIWEWLLDFPTASYSSFDEGLEIVEKQIKKYEGNEYVKVSVAPHSIYTVSETNLIKAKNLAKKYDTIFHIHLSETKKEYEECMEKNNKTPVEYLESLWLLDEKTILAHCVYLWENDFEILKNRKVNVSHCPLSNLKLWSWIAPVVKMLDNWINVTLGTDWSASSNRLDIWEAWKIAWLIQKWINNDSQVLNVKQIIKMMSVNSMKALWIEQIDWLTIRDYEKIIEETPDYSFLYHFNINEL